MPKLRLSPLLLVMNIALVVYGLTALLSLKTAYDLSLSEGTIYSIVASIVIYFALVVALRQTGRTHMLAALISVLGVVFSLLFISQFKYQDYVETPGIIQRLGNLTSFLPNLDVFIHPNSASTVIELLVPIVLALLLITKNVGGRIGWVVALLVLLYAFALTYSRGAFLGLAVALLVGLAAVGMKRLSARQATVLIATIVIVVLLVIGGLIVLGPRIPFVASLMGVTASRLEIYRNSLGLAGDYIYTGMGLGGTFAMVYARYSLMIQVPLFSYTHNLFLAVLLGQGIVGLIAFVVVIITFYLFIVRVMWRVRIVEPGAVFYGAWIGVTATLVHGLTDARQYVESPFNLPLLFVGMALAVGCGFKALREEAFEDRESKKIRGWRTLRLATALLVVVIIGGFVVFNKPVRAAWYTNLGALDETRSDSTIQPDLKPEDHNTYLNYARDEYKQALAIDADYPNANRRLGNLDLAAGAYEEAIPLLEKAYAAEPAYPATIKGLGLAYTWAGRTQEAACTFKKMPDVSAMGNELVTWDSYLHGQGQDLLAAYTLETLAILGDYQQTNMAVWVLTGDRFSSGGKPERAQLWYSRVLEKDPGYTDAAEKLKALGLERISIPEAAGCS